VDYVHTLESKTPWVEYSRQW